MWTEIKPDSSTKLFRSVFPVPLMNTKRDVVCSVYSLRSEYGQDPREYLR